MFEVRRWWLLCGAVLVAVVALNGVVNAKPVPQRGEACRRAGVVAGVGRGVVGRSLVCVRTRGGLLRWQFQPRATPATTTTVVGVVAPVVESASADNDDVRVSVVSMRPDTGVFSLQWVPYGQSFNTYQMIRATSSSMSVSVDWFACGRTYTFRVFVMQAGWLLADGHQTQNVTPHSTPFDVVMPACPLPAAPAFSLSSSSESKVQNTAITGYTITSTGGAIASYAISPSAPAGTSFDTSTGLLSGTPTTAQSATAYTITATNATGMATATFTLTVTESCANGGVCAVGDTGPGGGIVFYVASGTFTQIGAAGSMCTTTCKYLEAAPTNWLAGTAGDPMRTWATNVNSNQTTFVTGADGTAIGSGYQNSRDISAQAGNVAGSSAAVLAREYGGGSKTDWFLPSKDELNELCKYARSQTTGSTSTVCANTGSLRSGFASADYWSSSESNSNSARGQAFYNGIQYLGAKNIDNVAVRPVRAF